MNKVILLGNVGNQPEAKMAGQVKIVNLTIATNKKFKNKAGEMVNNTTWHNVVCWDKQADLVEKYVNKGDKILIEGELENREYENKEGQKVRVTQIRSIAIELLGSSNKQGSSVPPPLNEQHTGTGDNDLPF